MSSLLIDSGGELWGADSRAVRTAFDSPFSGGEFTRYAVRNLGFIGVHAFGNSCHLRLRPEFVSKEALQTFYTWMKSRQFERYVLSLTNDEETMELHRSLSDVFRAVETAVLTSRRAQAGDFLAEPSRETLAPPIVTLLEALRENPLRRDDPEGAAELERLIRKTFGNRFVIVGTDGEKSKLTFGGIGEELFSPYQEWRSQAIGAPVARLPDPSYGAWVETSYRRALQTQEALSERVDAIVRWPHLGRARMRYTRIILPFKDPSGAPMLISGTRDDRSIDLRIRSA